MRKDVNLFRTIGDSEIEKQSSLKTALTASELQYLKDVETAIKEALIKSTCADLRQKFLLTRKKIAGMEYVESQVILSTVHGAKGLEWDYVILGDIERWLFPGYYTCNNCMNKFANGANCCCTLPNPLPTSFADKILDELSVFYVGVTRAKKQVYVSASAKRLDYNGNEKGSIFSCVVGITGVKLIKAD